MISKIGEYIIVINNTVIAAKGNIYKLKSSSILYCLIFLCTKMYNLIRLYMRSQYEALHKLR